MSEQQSAAVERCRRLHGLEPGYVMGCDECEGLAEEVMALADVIFENSDEPMWSAVVIAKAQWDALADLLAARDRRVRAEAVREAAGELKGSTAWAEGPKVAAAWLRDRADRIEADA